MQSMFPDKRLRFLIGDVRDKERFNRALEDINIVIHAAALKHVPVAEYNPIEAVKTNVYGTQNLIECCLSNNVDIALGIGTDKAVSPLNTYGATKLLMERIIISANNFKGKHKVKFICVRYGNVLGSRGSIVETFINQIQTGKKITITDPTMTRFNITINEGVDLIFRALSKGNGGETFIPKLKAYKVGDMKEALMELFKSKSEIETISVRPGEKYHESLINKHELRNAHELDEDYVIIEKNQLFHEYVEPPGLKKIVLNDEYSSDNVELLTKNELKEILIKEKLVSSIS